MLATTHLDAVMRDMRENIERLVMRPAPLLSLEEVEKEKELQKQKELETQTRKNIANLFSLTVYLCDAYLEIKKQNPQNERAVRFFKIMQQLPMDLQIIMCHRAYNKNGHLIPMNDKEKSLTLIGHQLAKEQPKIFTKLKKFFT